MSATKLRIFGSLAVSVAIVELVLCFSGPIAFVQRPSLLLLAPFSTGLSDEQTESLAAFAERRLALTRSYQIVSMSFVEEYHVRTDPDFDKTKLKPADYRQAQEVARELGIDRFGICWVYHWQGGQWEMSISIRDVEDGSILRSGHFVAASYEDMLWGIDKDGKPFDFRGGLAEGTRGLSFTDYLVLALFALQLLVGLLALFGREPGVLVEIVCAPALILFVFAYIWALSANMDYVQRYVASGGNLRLAESTAAERLQAVWRFGPVLLLNAAYYMWRVLAARPGSGDASGLQRCLARWSLPWVLLSAALFGFSFPSALALEGLGALAWVSLVPLLLVLLTARPAMGVFYGVVFGALQAMIVNYWLGTYKYVTLHLVTIAFAAQYLLFMLPLVWLIKVSGRWGFLTVPAAWLLFDYLRSVGLLAYPWGLIGVTQYRFLPLIQIASVGGVWAVNFVVLFGNAVLAWAVAAKAHGWTWAAPAGVIRRRYSGVWLPLAVFAGFFVVCLAGGGAILRTVRHRLYGQPETPWVTVVLLQQNTDPRKHDYEGNRARLIALTDQALASLPEKADLVAWPEGGFKLDITYWGDPSRAGSSWGREVRAFRDYQRSLGTWLATGTQDHEIVSLGPVGESTLQKDFNSSVLLDADGRIIAFYHKMRLVPFCEYFPLDKERFAGLYNLFQKYEISDWDVGSARGIYQHEKMRFLTPICFEDVFSDHVRRFVRQDVDLILNMSNDYWSLSPVEGRQHGLHALFRAVENQRPLLRTTSSGYTVYVDAAGQIQPGSPQPYTAGYLIARVPLPPRGDRPLTLYARWGDWFPLSCGAALALAGLAAGIHRLVRVVGRLSKTGIGGDR